jgi:uncharacterized metal-binding protein
MQQRSMCAYCTEENRLCEREEGTAPPFCPMLRFGASLDESASEYDKDEVLRISRMASIQEGQGYGEPVREGGRPRPIKTRVEEIRELALKLECRRVGVAFCTGLRREAALCCRALESVGLEVVSVSCKVGCRPKESIGLKDAQKIRPGRFESMCNPVGQAEVLNEEGTELNVVVGLCVGHDALFFRYSRAPVTVLVAKDRVTGHNPAAALYNLPSYYSSLLDAGGN